MTKANILIGTPCYGGMLTRGYFHSILKLKDIAKNAGIDIDISTIGNESLITRGRCFIASQVLANKNYTHLLFIDADIQFDPLSVIRMVQADKEICAGAYPKKHIDFSKMKELIEQGVPADQLDVMASDYAINIVTDNNTTQIPIVDGFLKVSYAATGFMLIKREVLEKMVQSYPELRYANDVSGYNLGGNEDLFYAFFDTEICPKSKRYLSEDYSFCQKWLALGGTVWVDLLCDLTHYGTHAFRGSFLKTLEKFIQK
jgi:hypothetical protein